MPQEGRRTSQTEWLKSYTARYSASVPIEHAELAKERTVGTLRDRNLSTRCWHCPNIEN